jgi:hypothetical protein
LVCNYLFYKNIALLRPENVIFAPNLNLEKKVLELDENSYIIRSLVLQVKSEGGRKYAEFNVSDPKDSGRWRALYIQAVFQWLAGRRRSDRTRASLHSGTNCRSVPE